MVSYISGRWWRWKFRNVLPVVLLLICIAKSAVLSCQSNCNEVLTSSEGIFTSPCYPSDYPPSQSCAWTLQAPAGFIVQITFLDFELEEAHGCIYDRVVIDNGSGTSNSFCGLTANGLTLNSTGNVMTVYFNSDFSVQKKGFSISYRQVAVALRNQKVTLPQNSRDVIKVTSTVSIPELSEFTACFEIARLTQKGTETIFSYLNASKGFLLSFGAVGSKMELSIGSVKCFIDDLVTPVDLTSQIQLFCLTWSKTNGRVAVNFGGNYRANTCTASVGLSVDTGGSLELGGGGGGGQNFNGIIYNFRLWDSAMTFSELSALACDAVGNIVDWDNSFWDIPASYAQTDPSLSCICYPHCIHLTTTASSRGTTLPYTTPQTTSCSSSGLGCPAPLTTTAPSIVTTNTIPTNATTNATTSMPLTTTTVQTTSSSATTITPTTTSTTTAAATIATNEDTFYSITLTSQREITEETMANWFNQTFQGWNYTVKVYNISIQPGTDASSNRYTCKALLLYRNTTGKDLTSTEIETKLNSSSASGDLRLENVVVNVIENCPEEETLHYKWLETRPLDTKNISCFPYKEQNASRTCIISPDNYTSLWGQPDFSNCKDIEEIEVSSGNAAEVAVHLADITNNELSNAEVSKVVTVVKKLVNVARINATLATTVVTIISNVMITSDSAQVAASGTALKTMDELVQKIEFEGPSLSITSKNLAVGISALNISNFNGTSFSAFIPPNGTDPQIHFESEIQNPLAAVTLPATLLNNLSTADIETISRINFMFFSKTGLFQDQQSNGLSLNSYVVASSVGNFTISNLRDPVQIEIAHLQSLQENAKPQCVFWDFTMQNGSGGWKSEGCVVSSESSSNRTVCLCSHLTHFGILMDISGAAAQIDERDTKILTFITYIGCGISAIFSAVTILTYIAFEKLRRDYPSKILMNLSTSLLFLNMVFLLDGWLASYNMEGLCVAVAVFLHFFLLTSFTWMGLESIHMYIALVKVFNTYIRRYILKFCIVGWGLPAAIVGIVVAVDKDSYGKEYYGKGENGQGSSEFCWIRSEVVFYVTCVAYFSIIFLMNVAMFIVVMMQICGRNGKRSNRTVREEVLRNLRSAVSLTFLLGMTWGFAFFAWGPVNLAFMYLFSIFNSLQGLFIFIFHCALKENVQKQWRRYLCCGKFRLADNSDWSKTATNNTKKVSSDNLGKSLSSSSFGSTTANWTSKAKTTLNPFAKRHSSAGTGYSNQTGPKCSPSDADASTSSILPVHQVLDKVKGYCSVRSDNFYKNIMMSDSFSNSTKF
ncbi:adhesion G-protein coupled receptor G6 isoform X2 [Colossoma macropomum]|uniref:adhesion G-protein coupled receptor G6 isoform X2 n=1 Tax=Colossoma macropomum TaxID=42526 RepID=UPI0018647C9F|nr:adhesion G-protein coupled receptor G6 isoform X2 [Colossoma macropomum]